MRIRVAFSALVALLAVAFTPQPASATTNCNPAGCATAVLTATNLGCSAAGTGYDCEYRFHAEFSGSSVLLAGRVDAAVDVYSPISGHTGPFSRTCPFTLSSGCGDSYDTPTDFEHLGNCTEVNIVAYLVVTTQEQGVPLAISSDSKTLKLATPC
jgi:hypothetical protein